MRLTALCCTLALAALAAPACSKDKAPPPAQGTVGADGIRRIPVEAGQHGYEPATIHAKANERLILIFTRTIDSECLSQVKVAGGAPIDLPKGKAVEVPVTAPASGKLTFICGMDMQTGVVAVD